MSSRDMPESRPPNDDAIGDRDSEHQQEAPDHDVRSDDRTDRGEHGASEAGGYREQDYGGEPSHLPTEPQES